MMFEKAARLKLRFNTNKGSLTVEDLWDLPLTATGDKVNLDQVARDLHKQLKNDDDVSFVNKEKKSDEIVQLKFDIAKHIIEVRLAEDKARAEERSNKETYQNLLEIIAKRENEEYERMPLNELKKKAAEFKQQ